MSNINDETSIIDYDDIDEEYINEYVTGVKSCSTIDTNIMAIITAWQSGDLLIPKFQRRFVWSIEQASCFIDSLMSELPIPSIIIYKDKKGYQYILDGQQRIKSILYFIGELGVDSVHKNDKKFVNFRLKGLSPTSPFYEKTYNGNDTNSFTDEQRRTLRGRSIPITTIVLDNPNKDMERIYSIFRRLNTGGTPLTAQEIRYCVYSGSFNNFLYKLNENEIWQNFFTNEKDHIRQKDAELILRFFALQETFLQYVKPMKTFLSNYFYNNRECSAEKLLEKEKLFIDTINAIYNHLGSHPFHIKNKINSSAVDSIMVAFSRNLDNIPNDIKKRYNILINDVDYDKYIGKSSNDVKAVKQRIEIAEDILFKEKMNNMKLIQLFEFPVSAGNGNILMDETVSTIKIYTDNVKADFAVKISGDSMEPIYHDKDIILVRKQQNLDNGQVGIFIYDGEVRCKKYNKHKKNISLISLNKKYSPINISSNRRLDILGLVIGTYDPNIE